MKKQSFLSIIGMLSIMMSFQSCSLFLKSQINKQYPPVTSTDKKINAICNTLKVIDTTAVVDAAISIKAKLIDTIVSKTLEEKTQKIVFDNGFVDSLKILQLKVQLDQQEILLQTKQQAFCNDKKLKSITYSVAAGSAPYVSKDTLYCNPYFQSVYIHKIKYKGWLGFLTRKKILYKSISKLINNHLDNLNGQVKNYYYVFQTLPKDSLSVASLIQGNNNLTIVKNAMIQNPTLQPTAWITINPNAINIALQGNQSSANTNFQCPDITKLCKKEKKAVLDTLFQLQQKRYQQVITNNLDAIPNDSLISIQVRNGFIAETLNKALQNINFQFKVTNALETKVDPKAVYIPRPNLSCPSFSSWRCWTNPAFCAACHSARTVIRNLPSRIKAGTIGGNLKGKAILNCNLKSIQFDNQMNTVAIEKDLTLNGNVDYDFTYNGFNGIGFVLGCYNLQFKGNPNITGTITNPILKAKIQKENLPQHCNLKLEIEPIKYKVQLSTPPIVDLFANIKNHLTCSAGLTVAGITFGLGNIAGRVFDLGEVENYINAVTEGKYDSELELKSISIPLKYETKTPIGKLQLHSSWGNKSINAGL